MILNYENENNGNEGNEDNKCKLCFTIFNKVESNNKGKNNYKCLKCIEYNETISSLNIWDPLLSDKKILDKENNFFSYNKYYPGCINKYIWSIFDSNKQKLYFKNDKIKNIYNNNFINGFKYDGYLMIFKYSKDKLKDYITKDIIINHHLYYTYSNNHMKYIGEPYSLELCALLPDHRNLDKQEEIDYNFCGLEDINWNELLDNDINAFTTAHHVSIEQQNIYFIDGYKNYWIIDYEYY